MLVSSAIETIQIAIGLSVRGSEAWKVVTPAQAPVALRLRMVRTKIRRSKGVLRRMQVQSAVIERASLAASRHFRS